MGWKQDVKEMKKGLSLMETYGLIDEREFDKMVEALSEVDENYR